MHKINVNPLKSTFPSHSALFSSSSCFICMFLIFSSICPVECLHRAWSQYLTNSSSCSWNQEARSSASLSYWSELQWKEESRCVQDNAFKLAVTIDIKLINPPAMHICVLDSVPWCRRGLSYFGRELKSRRAFLFHIQWIHACLCAHVSTLRFGCKQSPSLSWWN